VDFDYDAALKLLKVTGHMAGEKCMCWLIVTVFYGCTECPELTWSTFSVYIAAVITVNR